MAITSLAWLSRGVLVWNGWEMKWKLTLSFDGAGFSGWQSQRTGRGVQDALEGALGRLFASGPGVISSSRTDAGVHAWGMVVHFEVPREECRMEGGALRLALNGLLPETVRVRAARRVGAGFHARFDAVGKEYRYRIWNDAVMHPLKRHEAWHVPRALDLTAMREAAERLVGRRDFRAFTSKRDGVLEDAVRTLRRCEVRRRGREVTVVMEGSGFLYKMCRGIVGTLVQVGEGKFAAEDVGRMLESGDRRVAGVNAPALGLVLWRVGY